MPELVLVHGIGVSPRYFGPLLGELRGRVDVVAPDLREESDVDGMVRLLHAAVAGRAWLLGNSFGCQLIAELAIRHPETVARAVFVGPTTDRRRRSWLRQAARLGVNAFREPPSLLPIIARDYLQTGPLRTLRMAREALNDPIEAKLAAFEAPLLVVRGERDTLCPQDWAEEVARRAPRARLEVVRGAAHAAHYSHPAELARLVLRFVEEPE